MKLTRVVPEHIQEVFVKGLEPTMETILYLEQLQQEGTFVLSEETDEYTGYACERYVEEKLGIPFYSISIKKSPIAFEHGGYLKKIEEPEDGSMIAYKTLGFLTRVKDYKHFGLVIAQENEFFVESKFGENPLVARHPLSFDFYGNYVEFYKVLKTVEREPLTREQRESMVLQHTY